MVLAPAMWHMRNGEGGSMDKEVQATRSDRIFRLIYRSRNTIPAQDRKAALGKLFSQARSSNSEPRTPHYPSRSVL
jgi:hypothetical protein